MKHYFFPALKALCFTLGLDGALLGYILVLSLLVGEPFFQAVLFFCVAICPVIAICLYANIHAEKRRTLWLCFGVTLPVHVVLSTLSMALYGLPLSLLWPGSSDLAPLLLLLMVVVAWAVATLTVTLFRVYHIGHRVREEKKQRKREAKGYRMEYAPVSGGRARFGAVCKGILWAAWLHLSTGLLLILLQKAGIADTMLAYIAFPTLWCLLAAAYGLIHNKNRVACGVSAAVSHLVLCVSSLIVQAYLYPARFEFLSVGHSTEHFLERPFNYPERLLTLTLFFVGGIAIVVFSIGHRNIPADNSPTPTERI